MNKNQAIARAGGTERIDTKRVQFSNINVAKDVWWLDVPLAKVMGDDAQDLDLLLFDDRSNELHHLQVPAAYFQANLDDLGVREKKQCIRLELKTNEPMRFQNVMPISSGVQFGQFVMRTV